MKQLQSSQILQFGTGLISRLAHSHGEHLAVLIGKETSSDTVALSIEAAARDAGYAYAQAIVRSAPANSLALLAEATQSLAEGVTPKLAPDTHPAIVFRRCFDAVIDRLEQPLVMVIDDLDAIEKCTNADDILAAVRAALMVRWGQVHAVFLVRDAVVRKSVFDSYARPMYLFANPIDVSVLERER